MKINRNFETILSSRRYQTLEDFEKVSERIRASLRANRLVLREVGPRRILLRAIYTEPLEAGWAGQDFLTTIASGTTLDKLPIAVDEEGSTVYLDFIRSPHGLLAGTSGSGKSVGLNALLASCVKLTPRPTFFLVDPKQVELTPWSPFATMHATSPDEMTLAIGKAKNLCDSRYEQMKARGIRNLNSDPEALAELGGPVFVVVDELAELLSSCGKDAGQAISSIAQIGRAASVFLICATQNPKAELFSKASGTETLRSNLSNILAFRVTRAADSDVILGSGSASEGRDASSISPDLPGAAYTSWGDERVRVPYLSDDQIATFVSDNSPQMGEAIELTTTKENDDEHCILEG